MLTYKKNPELLIVSSLKKKSYWVVHMPNGGITPPLLAGYNMDVLSKFLTFIVFYTFNSLFGKVLLMAEENF